MSDDVLFREVRRPKEFAQGTVANGTIVGLHVFLVVIAFAGREWLAT
jgi:hypothetical protein